MAKLEIPHPGRVIGQLAMMGTMRYVLEYIGSGFNMPQALGGAPITRANMRGERALVCSVPGIGAPKRPLTDADFKMRGIPGFSDECTTRSGEMLNKQPPPCDACDGLVPPDEPKKDTAAESVKAEREGSRAAK